MFACCWNRTAEFNYLLVTRKAAQVLLTLPLPLQHWIFDSALTPGIVLGYLQEQIELPTHSQAECQVPTGHIGQDEVSVSPWSLRQL